MQHVDLFVIHLVRDSRGAYWSWRKKKRRPEITQREEFMPQRGWLHNAFKYNLYNWGARALQERAKFLTIRYEDLVNQPIQVLDEIAAGLDIQVQQESAGLYHSCSGNPARFDNIAEIRPDFEWKKAVSLWPAIATSLTTLPYLLRYRYKLRWWR